MNKPSVQTENAGGDDDRGNGADNSAMNLHVDADVDVSASTDHAEYISPRTQILEARSSEEELSLSVSSSMVESRHKRIEETLLKDKKPISENTPKILSRHSMPANYAPGLARGALRNNSPSRSPLKAGNDDVLARARATIEGRKKSRETAKAKVTADIIALGGTTLSMSHSTSSLNDGAQVNATPIEDGVEVKKEVTNNNVGGKTRIKDNSARAKAQARLNATMALLSDSGKSPVRAKIASTNDALSLLKKYTRPNEEGKHAEIESQDKVERLEQEGMAAESPKQAELERLENYPIEQRHEEGEDVHRLADGAEAKGSEIEGQDKVERLEQEGMAAESPKQAELERLENYPIEQRHREGEDVHRLADGAEAKGSEEEVAAQVESVKQAELERREEEKIRQRRFLAEQLQKEEEEALSRRAKRERQRLAASETTEQTGPERVGKERIDQEIMLNEAHRLATDAEAAKQAEGERQEANKIEQRRLEEEKVSQVKVDRLKQEKLAAEAAKQDEIKRQEEEKVAQKKLLADADRLENERLAAEVEAAKLAETKKQEEEERRKAEIAKVAEIKRQKEEERRVLVAKAEQFEQERIEHKTKEPMSTDHDATANNTKQPSMTFDLIVNRSTSCSDSAPIIEKPSDASESLSLGQVDRLLYQGKASDLHQDDSEEEIFEGITNSESASQQSDAETRDDNTTFSTGPMWKKAAEEAAYTTAMKKDFVPRNAPGFTDEIEPSQSIPMNETSLTSKGSGIKENLSQVLPPEPAHSNYESAEEDRDAWLDESTSIDEQEEEEVGLKEWKGFKWNRMLYMLLFGIQFGLLPSIYAQQTCSFVTGNTPVGEDGVEFSLQFGLTKFAPIESTFQGISYCQKYLSDLNYKPPTLPRVASVAATIFGTIPLIVIGLYLRFSNTSRAVWNGSMWMLYMGFVCQISTLSIFLLDICQQDLECTMGPGAWTSSISALMWFILSIEMKMNSPLYQPIQASDTVILIEKETFAMKMTKIWQRINGEINGEGPGLKVPSLSRTAMKKQKRVRKATETEMSRYRPPEIV